ncbi:phosphoglycerate kinase [Thermoplasmatales archaeon SCGC AB-540-F20]|nr:phosphoglycerate kinase [Thermoplasmatales archaeon SCGC AB-540-F20]
MRLEKVLTLFQGEIYLPIDFAVSENENRKEIDLNELPTEHNLFDIGEKNDKKIQRYFKKTQKQFFYLALAEFLKIRYLEKEQKKYLTLWPIQIPFLLLVEDILLQP